MTNIPGSLNPPRCEAHSTGRAATEWGFTTIICQARRGLRSFTDAQGVERFFCPATGHRFDVERRFGKAGESCYLCGKPNDDLSIAVNLGADRLGLMCFRCQDDLAPLAVGAE